MARRPGKRSNQKRLESWQSRRAGGQAKFKVCTAMVFSPCEGVLGPELCRMKVSRQSHGRKKQGLKLVSRQLGGWKTAQTASFLAGSEKQR